MDYVTWEHYSSLYSVIQNQKEFDKLQKKAGVKIDIVTYMRAKSFEEKYSEETATPFQRQMHAQIQNTACELINTIYVQETSGMGTGVSSVSNDGYSETYKITTADEKENQLKSIIRMGLAGTGLVGVL